MRGDLRAEALRSRGDLPSCLLQGGPLPGCAGVSAKIRGDGGSGAEGVYVRDRRNRDQDDRRLWGDLRRLPPSRKEESEWTIISPATSTLNVGEVDSLFTEGPRRLILRTSPVRDPRRWDHDYDENGSPLVLSGEKEAA